MSMRNAFRKQDNTVDDIQSLTIDIASMKKCVLAIWHKREDKSADIKVKFENLIIHLDLAKDAMNEIMETYKPSNQH